jgi:hypothetical protein
MDSPHKGRRWSLVDRVRIVRFVHARGVS